MYVKIKISTNQKLSVTKVRVKLFQECRWDLNYLNSKLEVPLRLGNILINGTFEIERSIILGEMGDEGKNR